MRQVVAIATQMSAPSSNLSKRFIMGYPPVARDARLAQVDFRLGLRFGTFCPDRRASDRPMAMACLRLFTFFPDLPLRNVPDLRSCNALPTFLLLARLYFLAIVPPQ
jgi:hypothetical protein